MSEKPREKSRSPKTLRQNFQYHNICATFFWKEENDIKIIDQFFNDFCKYGVYGKEICPTTNRPHLQMYMELSRKMTINGIHKKLKDLSQPISNIATRHGTAKEAGGYCKKGTADKPEIGYQFYFDNPHESYEGYEYGTISHQGFKIAAVEVAEKIKNGEMNVEDVMDQDFHLYHHYKYSFRDVQTKRDKKNFRLGEYTKCVWLTGLPGRGKSHKAFIDELEEIGGYDPDKVYDWDLDQEYQCGYDGQEIVIINEFKGPKQISYGKLLKMIDKWPMKIKRKNPLPAKEFTSKKIIITSIFRPEEIQWNLDTKDDLDQLLDRIEVKELTGPNRRL